jgi:purine-binding chemotaxis protein CheW
MSAENSTTDSQEYVTFRIGGMLMGIDILQVQEINQYLDITAVPHSPEQVLGVINLRGEVVTVLDLALILGMPASSIEPTSRNLIVNAADEKIGVLVDGLADVVYADDEDIEQAPANVSNIDGHYIKGIYKLDNDLLILLNPDEILSVVAEPA